MVGLAGLAMVAGLQGWRGARPGSQLLLARSLLAAAVACACADCLPLCCTAAGACALQVEASKAQRADRISRDPDYDEQQGVARDYVSPSLCTAIARLSADVLI